MSDVDDALVERYTARFRIELKAALEEAAAAHAQPAQDGALQRQASGRSRHDRRPLFHEKRFEARESLLTAMVSGAPPSWRVLPLAARAPAMVRWLTAHAAVVYSRLLRYLLISRSAVSTVERRLLSQYLPCHDRGAHLAGRQASADSTCLARGRAGCAG
jgi:hypothetical protein